MFRSAYPESVRRPTSRPATRLPILPRVISLALPLLALLQPAVIAQQAGEKTPATKANYKLAAKFSSSFLGKFSYDTSVSPSWIGDSETFWYRFRTSAGRQYWLVDPVAKTKVALFDHDHLAALLSEACARPIDTEALDLRSVKFDKTGDEMTFVTEGWNFVYRRSTGQLEKKDKAKAPTAGSRTRGQRGRRGTFTMNRSGDGKAKEKSEKEKAKEAKQRQQRLLDQWRKELERHEKEQAAKNKKDDKDSKQNDSEKKDSEATEPSPQSNRGRRSAFSPNLELYVLAKKHNLYVVDRDGALQDLAKVAEAKPEATEAAAKKGGKAVEGDLKGKRDGGNKEKSDKVDDKGKDREKDDNGDSGAGSTAANDGKQANGKAEPAKKTEEKEALRFPFVEAHARQLSKDGEKDYSYGGREEDDFATPASVTWSLDSNAFFMTRGDSRGVAELFLVNSLGPGRPKLQQYKYPMPGEDKIRHSEFMMWQRSTGRMVRLKPKWKDESYLDSRWMPNGELRVLRRDRLRRNIEYGIVNPETGELKVLFTDSMKDAGLVTQSIRYLDDRGEFIWWSERSGWGHYYLYGLDGKLKNTITRGRFRASSIVDVDEEKGLLWFRGNGREKGESVYYEHLYRVRLDGGDLTLLDPGDATHRSRPSKSRKFLVDNCSRVDKAPSSVLRDGEGNLIMELEHADTSKLEEMGWHPPERFTVKAADGVTDLYGNMWKPFDFDETKKYPLIVHVYPGPQTEGVTHTFSATGSRQELAQVGFIVIQVGHRGGTPTRSKAYGSYGYYNMRDYPLEDKKTAIEQLAARFDFIDIDRIGIYGHSGGGFMTAAALLRKPYNQFFKVGVSTSGNHDNNVYNNSWAERYHGLKEAKDKEDAKKKADAKTTVEDKGKDKTGADKKKGGKKESGKKDDGTTNNGKVADAKRGEQGKDKSTGDKQQDKVEQDNDALEKKTRFDIKIATNAELAENLEGKLMLVHGEIDNNVHPAGTMRLVDALIKANKRFDMLIIPGARHSYGKAGTYAKHRTWEYFAEHLLGDHQPGADIMRKATSR